MVQSAERACFLQRQNVRRLLHHAKQLARARGVGADVADLARGEKSAAKTRMDRLARAGDGRRDLLRLTSFRLNHPERDPLGRPGTDSRHLPELGNQIPEGRGLFRSSQARWSLLSRRSQMQSQGFEAPQIQLKWCVIIAV